jgi:hypothetical protein
MSRQSARCSAETDASTGRKKKRCLLWLRLLALPLWTTAIRNRYLIWLAIKLRRDQRSFARAASH